MRDRHNQTFIKSAGITRMINEMGLETKCFCFDLNPLCIIKGQVLANFLVKHRFVEIEDVVAEMNNYISLQPWVLMFDGSKTKEGASVGVKVINPKGNVYRFVNQLALNSTNNQAEYEVLVLGLRVLITMGAQYVHILEILNW